MKNLALLAVGLLLVVRASGECVPDYQLEHEACKETDQVESVSTKLVPIRIRTAECQPSEWALCQAYSIVDAAAAVRGGLPETVRLRNARTEDAKGQFCGPLNNVRWRQNVYCDFDIGVVKPKMRSDPTCPVHRVIERNKCYADEEKVNVPEQAIIDCVDGKAAKERDLWIKAACLIDISKALGTIRLELPEHVSRRVMNQLTVLKTRNDFPVVQQFILTELSKQRY